ncbi:unnamed protein product [Arabidopsis arenosa]|uniref:Ubiquitin-like protease family profile domain-containing protein n=1 Tax=Arabidopsis arenosa TaxID=38785 RepID=A0A8S2A716_ARAAE|nr:unnamed protein product [Arabidopsis arenosa]
MADALTDPSDHRNFVDWSSSKIPKQSTALTVIHAVEQSESLCVDPIVYGSLNPEVFDWDDEVKDKKVDYLLEKVRTGYRFSKLEWPGGDCSAKLIRVVKKKCSIVKKKHVKPRSKKHNLSVEKNPSSLKRRRSARNSERFEPLSRDDLVARVECLESELVQIKTSFDLQVQRLSSHADKLEKKFKSMKQQRHRKKSFRPISSRKVLRQTFLPYSKHTAHNATAPVAPSDGGLTGSGQLGNLKMCLAQSAATGVVNSIGAELGFGNFASGKLQSAAFSGVDNSIAVELGIGNAASGKGKSHNDTSGDESGDKTLGDTDAESSAEDSSASDEGQLRSQPDDPPKPAPAAEPNGKSDHDTIGDESGDKTLGDTDSESSAEDSSASDEGQLRSQPHDPAKPAPAAEPNGHGQPQNEDDAPMDIDNTTTSGLDIVVDNACKPHTSHADMDINPPQSIVSLGSTPNVHEEDPVVSGGVLGPVVNNENIQCHGQGDTVQANIEGHISDTFCPPDGFTDKDVFETPFAQQLAVWNPSTFFSSILNYTVPNQPYLSASCTNKQTEDAVSGFSTFNAQPTSELDISLPIFDTSSKPQKEGREELPIYDTATKSSAFQLSFCSAQHEIRRPEVDVKSPAEMDNLDGDQDSAEVACAVDVLELSDSSPARKREFPILSSQESQMVGMLLRRINLDALPIIPDFDQSLFDAFYTTLKYTLKRMEHLTACGYVISNKAFLTLAEPQKWVTHLHIELLLNLISRSYSHTLARERSAVVLPWFANALQGKYRAFKAAKAKNRLVWPDQIKRFLKTPHGEWFDDIDTIYVPMIWEDEHWVGLVIHLGMWLVEILDPNIGLYCDRKVKNFIAPVVEQLPYIIRRFCKPQPSQNHGLEPFLWQRLTGIYENKRSGDCGPLAIKLLEMHCHGGMSEVVQKLDDNLVDIIRKQYAMDVYAAFVAPLYSKGSG